MSQQLRADLRDALRLSYRSAVAGRVADDLLTQLRSQIDQELATMRDELISPEQVGVLLMVIVTRQMDDTPDWALLKRLAPDLALSIIAGLLLEVIDDAQS